MRVQTLHLRRGAGDDEAIFAVCRRPFGQPRGAVLCLHPFAEELNKSRRMTAQHAQVLAADGWLTLSIDHFGCGDSAGRFADATWQAWIDDARMSVRWLRAECAGPLWIWGLRAGCLIAAATVAEEPGPDHMLWWQPPQSGAQVLQQFLRLKSAASALHGDGRGVMAGLKKALSDGNTVDIAGYELNPGLASGLGASQLNPERAGGRLCIVERTADDPAGTATAATRALRDRWQQAGWRVDLRCVAGPAFWQTTEIEVAPEWIEASRHLLRQDADVAA